MPNRKTHGGVGLLAGAGYSAYRARNLDLEQFLPEFTGGCIGGTVGGLLPDIFEPPINSWHRSTAHSYSLGAVQTIALAKIGAVQQWCRTEAQRHEFLGSMSQDDWSRFWHAVVAFLLRLISGFATGLPAGYLSHLVLDAATPRSVPFL